jgi:hypothetical protein
MTMKQSLSILALAAATLFASGAFAQTTIRAVASGPSESPPNGSPGSSVATFELDGDLLRAEVPFRDLVAGATMAHIHCCTTDAFTGTAGIAIPFVDFPLGVTAGTYTHAFDLTDAAVYDPAFLAAFGGTPVLAGIALLDGINSNEAYLNIHTSEFPAGEIRGFLVAAPIPEPATWGMLGLGLAGLSLVKRRRA